MPSTVEQKDKENGLIQLPGLNKFMVISQSMAETLGGVTPEMLKSARKKGIKYDPDAKKNAYEARRIKLARDVMENIVDYDSRSASFTRMELQEKRQQKKAPEKTEERTVSL